MRYYYITVLLLVLAWRQVQAQTLSCAEKGFDADIVQCKICEQLKSVTDGPTIYAECKQCCNEDEESAIYSCGTLIYCSCTFQYDPELSKLVASIPKKFPNIKTKDNQGAKLQLEMQKHSGEIELIPVESWSHENIIDFLNRKLDQNNK